MNIKKLLGLTDKYSDWYNFKKHVLLPAIEEINTKIDIQISERRDVLYFLLAGKNIDSKNELKDVI